MKQQILIIDDSLTVRMDLAEAFRTAGYLVSLSETAAQARAVVESAPPALILLDVVLPDGDGIDFLAELRAAESTRFIPVVLLSSEAEVRDRIRGLEQGADEYISKPYEADDVVARADRLLRCATPNPDGHLTILVIDSSLTYREELAERLQLAGYRTKVASSGEDGLKKAADLHPDLIIADGAMEGMDGTAIVRRIRLDPALQATPCLLLTASESVTDEVLADDFGADAYIRKFEGIDTVLGHVAALLRSAQASRDRLGISCLLGPKRILAVDDSRTYLEELASTLRDEGFEVLTAGSGEEALESLKVKDVDCILLDLLMPGLSGTETCRRIKGTSTLRRIPLIMLTALEEQEAMIAGINAGADDYVAKSAQFDVLKARVRAQLRRKQFEDENRRVSAELLRKDIEAEAVRKISKAQTALLDELSEKNKDLAFHIGELQRLNKELEVFAYSVSHDLRQPLSAMDGFSQVMLEKYGSSLDDKGRHYLNRISAGSQRMSELIDGLLVLSQVSRRDLVRRPVNLDVLAKGILVRLQETDPERIVEIELHEHLEVLADPQLMESALENLIGNAWKFTSKCADARIEIGVATENGGRAFFVRDNGAGLDMTYADKLFGPFQRLHSQAEFPGTGIGLATVQRIVHRHGGRIWVESTPGDGATFFFNLKEDAES